MARKVEMWMAGDGQVFDTSDKCTIYERKLADEEMIDRFLRSDLNVYSKSAHMTVAENTLLAFCAYKRGDEPTVKEEAQDDG